MCEVFESEVQFQITRSILRALGGGMSGVHRQIRYKIKIDDCILQNITKLMSLIILQVQVSHLLKGGYLILESNIRIKQTLSPRETYKGNRVSSNITTVSATQQVARKSNTKSE